MMLSEGAKGKAKLLAGTSSNKIVCDVLKKIKNLSASHIRRQFIN
jgi:hypothetical protein